MNAHELALFHDAILDPAQGVDALPLRAPHSAETALRFAVYRNNSLVDLIDHLRVLFPAVVRLLGDEYFQALAGEAVRAQPPTQPVLQEYGGHVPDFIARFVAAPDSPLQDYPWLADVARLEWARQRAFFAAEPDLLTLGDLGATPVQTLLLSTFEFQPSVHGIASAYPVWQLWAAQHDLAEPPGGDAWRPENVVVWRRQLRVEQRPLNAVEWRLFCALSRGLSLATAVQHSGGELAAMTQLFTRWVQDDWFCARPPVHTSGNPS